MNVVEPIPGFIGGVSQQSPVLRLGNQAEAMENCHATIEDGLMQRPNADLIKVLGAITAPTGMKIHKINRDTDEKYFVVFTTDETNPVRVYDLTGTAMTMHYGYYDAAGEFHADNDKKDYLRDAGITDARAQIKAVSIADYTIVVNTKKTCAMTDSLSTAQSDMAFVYFKGCHKGTYKITYKWTVDSTPVSVTKSHAVAYEDGVLNYDTASLLEDFKDDSPHANITVSGTNNVLKVCPTGGQGVDTNSLRVHVSDPYGGQDLIPINYCEVESIDKLPPGMPEDVVIKIGGDTEINQDDYYMKFHYEGKKWVEDIGFNLKYELDVDTLPHRLMRTASDEFTWAPIEWEDMFVGDGETNPQPSFIGNTINNTTFAKNRLWLYSKDNAVGSKAGDYFNYFAGTVMDVLDDDPIDVAAASGQVANLRAGIMFNKGLLTFSDEEQFALTSGDNLLTPKTAAMDGTTAFSIDIQADPVKIGSDVYFISPRGSYLSVREYTIMPDSLMEDAYNVTSHVLKYIPKGNALMAGCNQMDMLFLWSSATIKTLYTYKFMWAGAKKVQQAWYKWTFADEIKGFQIFDTTLYILFYNADDGYRLEKINLETISTDSQDMRYHLDSLKKFDNGSFDDPDTTFALDVDVGDGSDWTVVDASDNTKVTEGFTLVDTTLTFTGVDVSEEAYYVGRNYEMVHRFSEWYIKDDQERAVISGTTKIRSLMLSFINTGYFTIETTPFSRDVLTQTLSETLTGIKVGESIIGSVTLLSGEMNFPIMADSRRTIIELKSDSYLPVAIQLGAWEGTFTMRSKLI